MVPFFLFQRRSFGLMSCLVVLSSAIGIRRTRSAYCYAVMFFPAHVLRLEVILKKKNFQFEGLNPMMSGTRMRLCQLLAHERRQW